MGNDRCQTPQGRGDGPLLDDRQHQGHALQQRRHISQTCGIAPAEGRVERTACAGQVSQCHPDQGDATVFEGRVGQLARLRRHGRHQAAELAEQLAFKAGLNPQEVARKGFPTGHVGRELEFGQLPALARHVGAQREQPQAAQRVGYLRQAPFGQFQMNGLGRAHRQIDGVFGFGQIGPQFTCDLGQQPRIGALQLGSATFNDAVVGHPFAQTPGSLHRHDAPSTRHRTGDEVQQAGGQRCPFGRDFGFGIDRSIGRPFAQTLQQLPDGAELPAQLHPEVQPARQHGFDEGGQAGPQPVRRQIRRGRRQLLRQFAEAAPVGARIGLLAHHRQQ